MAGILEAMANVSTVVNSAWTTISSNDFFATLLAISLVSAGVGVFTKFKRAASK